MGFGKVFLSSAIFLFYVFSFQDLVNAISALSPMLPLFKLLQVLPYILSIVLGVLPIYFFMDRED